MRKLFTILCVMTVSNTFGMYQDGTVDINLETGIMISFDPTNTRPSAYPPLTFDEISDSLTPVDDIMCQLIMNDTCGYYWDEEDEDDLEPDPWGRGIEGMTQPKLHKFFMDILKTQYWNHHELNYIVPRRDVCYKQMFSALQDAQIATGNITDDELRCSILEVIANGYAQLIMAKEPKRSLLSSLGAEVTALGACPQGNVPRMYDCIHNAISWAEAGDFLETVVIVRS